MKKAAVFILIVLMQAYSQGQASRIVNDMEEAFNTLSVNMERAMNYTLIPLTMNNQTSPMPQYSFLKEKGVFSYGIGLLWNTLLPSLSSDSWKKGFKSSYRSPVKSLFVNDNSFLAYNFGLQLFFRDNRPIYRRFIYRMEYDGMYATKSANNLIALSPVLSGVFNGVDSAKAAISFTKIDVGVDFVPFESRYLDAIIGLGYTFSNANLEAEADVYETISDINPNPDIKSHYNFVYKMTSHYISIPITFNAKIYKDIITAYLGYNFNINIANTNTIETKLNFATKIPVPTQETFTRRTSISPDIFHGRLYGGFNIHMFGIQFYYIHNPSILGLTVGLTAMF